MPPTRNALIRYKTIDDCLRNRNRKWTLQHLIDACSEALYEFSNLDKKVSKRTIQKDIEVMRSDALGYNAPIITYERKYYTYEDPSYSISKMPLTHEELLKLSSAVEVLRQFKGFDAFKDLTGLVQKLEDRLSSMGQQEESVISLEKNEHLTGLEYLDPIYQAILERQPLEIEYKTFGDAHTSRYVLHPYYLKEYRNRWYVLGMDHESGRIIRWGLDRIKSLREKFIPFQSNQSFNIEAHFRDVIGVTVQPGEEVQEVLLLLTNKQAPYHLTKPFHSSQEIVRQDENGTLISLRVRINYELEREIMALGEKIKVVSPEPLKKLIQRRLTAASDRYKE
ncbi:MAG: WYL domain-containing protein [Bacteroidota bacterium]